MNSVDSANLDEAGALLASAKKIARRYRELTGRPLGITGEVAEYEACHLLGLELADVRSPGFDAIRPTAAGPHRLQIKARVLSSEKAGGRVGSIDTTKEWDAVLLVLLDTDTADTPQRKAVIRKAAEEKIARLSAR